MKKFVWVLIAGVFITGIIASVSCLAYSQRVAVASCHNKAQPVSTGDDSCLSHCLKQELSAITSGSQLSRESKGKGEFSAKSPAFVGLQSITINPVFDSTRYINLFRFTPLFNHSPPSLL